MIIEDNGIEKIEFKKVSDDTFGLVSSLREGGSDIIKDVIILNKKGLLNLYRSIKEVINERD